MKEVIDEIVVDAKGATGTFARDNWIATQLKTQLLFDKNVYSINYTIETVRGVVYVMGIAQDAHERDLVLQHSRNIEKVRRVVSYVLLKDDPRRQGLPPGTVTKGDSVIAQPGAQPGNAPPAGDTSGTADGTYFPPASSNPPPRGGGSIQAVPLDTPPSVSATP